MRATLSKKMKNSKENLYIIKVGGNIINNNTSLQSFLKDFAAIKGKKILVHGGGKKATEIGRKLGIKPNYKNGRRITDKKTIDLVTMVYGGLINKQIVAQLQALNCNAIGLTGADANIIPANKRPVEEVDYGFVGDIENKRLNAKSLKLFIENNLVTVFAALTHDQKGQMLNTNADTIASSLAISLSKAYEVRLIYCFEKKGILKNMEDDDSVVPLMNKEIYEQMLAADELFEGILPKLYNAFRAIDEGVDSVLIGHADDIIENTGEKISGTLIVA